MNNSTAVFGIYTEIAPLEIHKEAHIMSRDIGQVCSQISLDDHILHYSFNILHGPV